MNNQLNILTDADLSAVFAVEVAGWIPLTKAWCAQHKWMWPRYKWATPDGHPYDGDPIFATSMDSVLPYIKKQGWSEIRQWNMEGLTMMTEPMWLVRLIADGNFIESESTALPRAACMALISVKRAENLLPRY